MAFYYFKGILIGGLLGLYYGEKSLPFPVQYLANPNEAVL